LATKGFENVTQPVNHLVMISAFPANREIELGPARRANAGT
jgi:hypothetical protein